MCCHDGYYHGNEGPGITNQAQIQQKPSQKMNAMCFARMYIDELSDGSVMVTYIPAHTGHIPGPAEQRFLPLPVSIQGAVSSKLALEIPAKRVLWGNIY